ncbi:MAG TPA: sterol desaturase family protein [Pirellulales bacterium]|nr:sterol desaturase family protein [Pirellulales bacterium]
MIAELVSWIEVVVVFLAQGIGLFVVASLAFDGVHWLLHVCLRSRWPLLRKLAWPHQVHHDFLDRELVFHDDRVRDNLLWHVLPEYTTQVAVCLAGLMVLPLEPVATAILFFSGALAIAIATRGKDGNHVAFTTVPPTHDPVFIRPPYHALHHVYPDAYYGSYTTLFDRLMGTACQLRGKRIAMTGASGAFGKPLKRLLERRGAEVVALKFGVDFDYGDYARCDARLAEADILVLCHGSKCEHAMAANCDSFVALVERYKLLARGRRLPAEVWAVGSEIELHPTFGNAELVPYRDSKRAFARHAARLLRDPQIVYRHIVPSSFRSPMGPGLMSGAAAARGALFLIERGFHYVPVTYTGIALLNYLKLVFLPATAASTTAAHPARSV